MGIYLEKLTNTHIFTRLCGEFIGNYTFEPENITDTTDFEGNPLKQVRLFKVEECSRTSAYTDLFISDYDIFQLNRGTEPLSETQLMSILSALYMDIPGYEQSWKSHHLSKQRKLLTQITNSVKEETEPGESYYKDNYKKLLKAHQQNVSKIRKGLPQHKYSKSNLYHSF